MIDAQAKRNKQPMTPEQFKRNLSGVNGGVDFEPAMLEEIFTNVK